MSRVIEEMFIREGISYKIFGGLKFYDRKEIKDVLAYLRVIQNPGDNISLKRIINEPKRGIGNVTVDTAEQLANKRGVSIFTIISSAQDIPELSRAWTKLDKFVSLINSFRVQSQIMTASEMIGEVIERTGILSGYEQENTVEAQTRIENIKELISVAMEFENENEEKSLMDFLAHVSLVSDVDTMDEDSDYVTLMTLHSAKGLEFSIVFMVGMDEGIFPGYRSMTSETERAEEIRLCYVGITRAMESLYMTSTFTRTLFGNTTFNRASRFVNEIPEEYFEGNANENKGKTVNNSTAMGQKPKNKKVAADGGFDPTVSFNAASFKAPQNKGCTEVLDVGDQVRHKMFGEGIITHKEKDGDDFMLEIHFKGKGMKRLMAGYAKLEKIN